MTSSKHKFTMKQLGLDLPICPKCKKATIMDVLAEYDGVQGRILSEEVECQNCSYKAPQHVYKQRQQSNTKHR